MNGLRLAVLALVGIAVSLSGSEPVRAQFYGGIGYGSPNGYNAGSHASGAYSFNNWYVSPYGVYSPGYVGTNGNGFGYTRNYGMVPLGYGPGFGYGGYGYGPGYGTGYGGSGYGPGFGMGSAVVATPPVYGGVTTVIRGGPGSVINYSNNGSGNPYPAAIPRQPALGISRPYIPSSPPSVVIEVPSQGSGYGLSNQSSLPSSTRTGANIKLVCPKTAGGPLTYALNGHLYTIQPGYSQNFRDDRVWTLEFKQGGDGSEAVRYTLKPGTYNFAVGANGWELRQPVTAPAGDLPPAPIPELTTTPSSTPTPLPPP